MSNDFDIIEVQRLVRESASLSKLYELWEWVSKLYENKRITTVSYWDAKDTIFERMEALGKVKQEIDR